MPGTLADPATRGRAGRRASAPAAPACRCLAGATWGVRSGSFAGDRAPRPDRQRPRRHGRRGRQCTVGESRQVQPGPDGDLAGGRVRRGDAALRGQPRRHLRLGRVCRHGSRRRAVRRRDNDCDGAHDEDCPARRARCGSCYDGPPATAGVGPCRAGTMTCSPTGSWSTWCGRGDAATGGVQPRRRRLRRRDGRRLVPCPAGQTRCTTVATSTRAATARWCRRATTSRRCPDVRGDALPVEPGGGRGEARRSGCVEPPRGCPPDLHRVPHAGGRWRQRARLRGRDHLRRPLRRLIVRRAAQRDVPARADAAPRVESEIWECRPMCDNGQYDIHMLGSAVICIPC